eukprot:scaffold11136_cov66-Phaeocystis_antarctica.AAC.5
MTLDRGLQHGGSLIIARRAARVLQLAVHQIRVLCQAQCVRVLQKPEPRVELPRCCDSLHRDVEARCLWRHGSSARFHLVEKRDRLLPLPRLLASTDGRSVAHLVGLDAIGPHLPKDLQRLAPVLALGASRDGRVARNDVRLQPLALHLVKELERSLPCIGLGAGRHNHAVVDRVGLRATRKRWSVRHDASATSL